VSLKAKKVFSNRLCHLSLKAKKVFSIDYATELNVPYIKLTVYKVDGATDLPRMSLKARKAMDRLDQKYSGTGNVK